jgi:AMIN domain
MKARNSNSLCFCSMARRMVLSCVGLLSVVFSAGALVQSLHAQDGLTSGQSTNLGQVTVQTLRAKTMAEKNAATQSQITNTRGATIEQIHLSGKDQQTQVCVDSTGYLTYEAFRLNQPDRLVLDFSGSVVRVQERSLSSSSYPVRLVHIGQFKANVARLEIEIEEQVPYTVTASGNAVTVVFSPVAADEPRVTTEKEIFSSAHVVPPELVPSVVPHQVENSQEAKSLSELSMQSALARPSRLEAEPSAPVATEWQTVQAQTQPATSGSIPQTGDNKAPNHLLSSIRQPSSQLSPLRKRFLAMSSARMTRL